MTEELLGIIVDICSEDPSSISSDIERLREYMENHHFAGCLTDTSDDGSDVVEPV